MLLPLHAVEEVCDVPQAGLRSLRLIDPDDLSVPPVWYFPAGLISALTFKPGKAAYAFPIRAFTGSLTDTQSSDVQGDRFEYDLDAFVKGITPGMETLRQKLRGRRVHLDVTYGDGQRRLIPNVRLFIKGKSGNRGGNSQGYDVSGGVQLSRPAPFTKAVFPVIGPPYVPPPDAGDPAGSSAVTLETSGSTYSYIIPAGRLLVCIELQSDAAQTPSIGFSSGSEEIGGPIELSAGQPWICAGLQVTSLTSTNIHFSGLAGTNTIKLWLLD